MFALVTGPTGFLGSYLVERLRAAGHRVRALVYGPLKNLAESPGTQVVPADITVPASLTSVMDDIDVVFHTAALVSNWATWGDFLAVTVHGTENVLRAAVRARVNRFVHISTTRVYDDRFCRKHGTVTEDAPQAGRGFRHFGNYARSKVMAEAAVWAAGTRLPVSVIRPAWIYGPRDEVILPAIVRFLTAKGVRWPGRHDPCADPIYVTDVADCAIAAALAPNATNQIYHAAPQARITVRQFLGALCRELGVRTPERSLPYALATLATTASEWWACLTQRETAPVYNRAGLAILTQDVRHSPSKAERELGWHAQVDLQDGIRRTAEWLRQCSPLGERFKRCPVDFC
jgi:nucleoside-diphosphate-sugar epimerase